MFSELDRKENSVKGPKQNPPNDLNNVMAYYQNGLEDDDSFKEDKEDNSGWTEVVRGRSSKGKTDLINQQHTVPLFLFKAIFIQGVQCSKASLNEALIQ